MSKSKNPADPVKILLNQFKTLNDQLKTCTDDLKKINESQYTINKLEFQQDEIDSNINIEQTGCEETIERMKTGWEVDLSKLQTLENYLKRKSKEKDIIEDNNKNLHILDGTYDAVQKEILERDSKSFSKNEPYSFEKAKEEIDNEIDSLYDEYENALDSRITTNRSNYMKSTADTLFETVKNMVDTLQTSYAFYNYSNKIRP